MAPTWAPIPPEVEYLFSWNPPKLLPLAPDDDVTDSFRISTKIRSSEYFDKHFHKALQLLHVKRLPNLVHDIAALVDVSINDVQFPSEILRLVTPVDALVRGAGTKMADEKAVASFYERTTATLCAQVASVLALQVPYMLHWTQSANVRGYAIADGFLHFVDAESSSDMYAILDSITDKEMNLKHIRTLAAKGSSLATFQFKKLAAGGRDVMLAIPRLTTSPIFDWTVCDSPDCATNSTHEKERKKAAETEARIGPDARITPWTLDPQAPSNNLLSPDMQGTDLKRNEIDDQSREQASYSVGIQPPATIQGPEPLGTSKAQKRKRGNEGDNQRGERAPYPTGSSQTSKLRRSARLVYNKPLEAPLSMPPPPPPEATFPGDGGTRERRVKAKKASPVGAQVEAAVPMESETRNGKENAEEEEKAPPVGFQVEPAIPRESDKQKGKRKVEEKVQDGVDDDDLNDPSYRDDHGLSALHIIQQAWAQATRADTSSIVIQSGNSEFLGIRHRRTQTLYISDLIEPHSCKEPAYGKLHVGLYMAAAQDAIDREIQRAAGTGYDPDGDSPGGGGGYSGGNPSGGGPSDTGISGDGPSSGPGDRMRKEDDGTGSGGSTMAIDAAETWEVASQRNVILVYLQYGVYDSAAPSTFVRSEPTGQVPSLPSREIVRNYKLEECLTIVLKSEIGHGAIGEVLRGTLVVEESACARLDVAVKLAFTSKQHDAIRDEYKMYHLLRKSGVTTGITTPLGLFDDVEGETCALVMPYVGIPLSEMPEFVLPIPFREAVLENMKKIHQANILHGDVRLDNILLADSGLTIIDFDRSRVCYCQDAKNREYSQLKSLLTQRAKWSRHHED